jgi:photosystem II stability/assembly factor-like uncharacterized protein
VGQGWERLAARTGGTVAALAVVKGKDGTATLFAATPTGLHHSTDAGQSWTPTGEGNSAPFTEAIAASSPKEARQALYVGARNGLYRSLDGGRNWQLMLVGSRVFTVATVESARGEQAVFAGTETDGILRSDDGGRSWTGANPGLLDLTVLALAFSPSFARDQTGFAATATGLYRTRNGGRAWRAVDLPLDDPAVQALAVSPQFAEDRLVLAGTEADGLLRSDDAGASWEPVPDLAGHGVTAIAISHRYAEQPAIAAATGEGVAISDDGGATWRMTAQGHGPVLSLAFVPHGDGEALVAGLPRQGAIRSEDGGATWEPAGEGLYANLLLSLALSPAFAEDRTLFAAGLEEGVTVSTDGGATWEARNEGLADTTVFAVSPSPDYARDRTVYAATASGLYRSRDGAASWQPLDTGPGDEAATAVGAIVAGPSANNRPASLLGATLDGRLLASDDGGESWRSLGQGFPGAGIVALAFSPGYAQDRTLFAATNKTSADGTSTEVALWHSADGGEHWDRWLDQRGLDVLPLSLPPTYPSDGTLFVGVGARVRSPMRNMQEVRGGTRRPIWRSVELGGGSTSITALAVSPNYRRDSTLFAATSAGVYVSRDGGQTFRDWSEGLDPARVLALTLSPDYATDRLVYVVGLGGTIWRRRDG